MCPHPYPHPLSATKKKQYVDVIGKKGSFVVEKGL